MLHVYIAKCRDGSYYVGVTNNLERRQAEHNAGVDPGCYTFLRRPVTIVYYESFGNPQDAITREKQLKGWRRAKKEALIAGQDGRLMELSKSYAVRGSGLDNHGMAERVRSKDEPLSEHGSTSSP